MVFFTTILDDPIYRHKAQLDIAGFDESLPEESDIQLLPEPALEKKYLFFPVRRRNMSR